MTPQEKQVLTDFSQMLHDLEVAGFTLSFPTELLWGMITQILENEADD